MGLSPLGSPRGNSEEAKRLLEEPGMITVTRPPLHLRVSPGVLRLETFLSVLPGPRSSCLRAGSRPWAAPPATAPGLREVPRKIEPPVAVGNESGGASEQRSRRGWSGSGERRVL